MIAWLLTFVSGASVTHTYSDGSPPIHTNLRPFESHESMHRRHRAKLVERDAVQRPKSAKFDYWAEVLDSALEEAGVVAPTDAQLWVMARALQGAAEHEGMSDGRYEIPNPAIAEAARVQQQHEQELRLNATRERVLREALARRLGVSDPNRISVNHGQIDIT